MRFIPIATIESKIAQSFKAAGKDCVVIFNRVPIKVLDKAAKAFNQKNNSLQAIVQPEPPPGNPDAIGILVLVIGSETYQSWVNYSIGVK